MTHRFPARTGRQLQGPGVVAAPAGTRARSRTGVVGGSGARLRLLILSPRAATAAELARG
eukprot:CAMPEP_0179371098 /NCGR_PEP_ID=MMETSP0797-20121207/85531_1 /TAXON_ID=47934 /ORGANISM="Dinophysis acuminata, Strain DAEP01" /LENGTH=59 /DNA_ID=CAMNT_0021086901 /DNA_START=106 /DNA_END=281 /DNA_ORIENTATION=-